MMVYNPRLRSPLVNSGRRERALPSDISLSFPAFTKRFKNLNTPKAGVPSHSASRPKVAETSLRRWPGPCAIVRSYRTSVLAKAYDAQSRINAYLSSAGTIFSGSRR